MKKRAVVFSILALSMLLVSSASAAILASDMGVFGDANAVYEKQFTYNPATMGAILTIQTYGFGGSSNAPGGKNAAGQVIAAGGFDPVIALYSSAINGGGAQVGFNDDGTCGAGAGALDLGACRDSGLVFNNLAAGTYSLVLTVLGNTPPSTENGSYPGAGSFGTRNANYAVDIVAIPEPMTSMLLGIGLLGLAGLTRRRQSK